MTLNRRQFLLGSSAAIAASACIGKSRSHAAPSSSQQPLGGRVTKAATAKKILVLGGTGFLGPHIIEFATKRGHAVTIFNRGKTRPDWFPELDKRRGDRDPKKGDGLKSLETGQWDAVIDDSGYFPRHVKASAELLAKRTNQYIFISSISAYKEPHPVGGDESSPLAVLKDPAVEDMGKEFENYGGLKALCEQAVSDAMPGQTTIVRPGFIVGPDDPTGRFTYWPVRFSQPGEIAVPGSPTDPVQVIDVRDLAQWLVALCETNTVGAFTACGPSKLRWGRVIKACQSAAKSTNKVVWIPDVSTIDEAAFPIWAPPRGDTAGFHTWSNKKAVKSGLRFRQIEETVADTLRWYRGEEKQAKEQAAAAEQAVGAGSGSAQAKPPLTADPARTRLAYNLELESKVLEKAKALRKKSQTTEAKK